MPMDSSSPLAFETRDDLEAWLAMNHDRATELWVRIFKKGSGRASVDWNDCVIAGLCWGWIDGLKRPLDGESFLQRMTPRKPRSGWSRRNRDHAERLIAEGRMHPSGLVHVAAARADGRWESAYEGSATMTMPEDFLAALDAVPEARAFFATLDRANLFAIYHRLQTAKTAATRDKRIRELVARLANSRPLH